MSSTTPTTTPATRTPSPRLRLRRAIVAAVLALTTATGAAALIVAPAGAATGSGPYLTVASPSLNVRTYPSTAAPIVGSLPYHSKIFISCQATGTLVGKSTVWDRLSDNDYISDYWTNTPGIDAFTPSIPRCAVVVQPAPPGTGTAQVGRTVTANQGTAGQCTWWAINEFHAYSGLYPNFTRPGNNGNAEFWAGNAAYDGWTVVSTPRIDSVAVFPPGVNGADSVGHVAWVTKVSGGKITITEMNATAGAGNVDTRTLAPASSVRYILAP